jgi:hypothetical protein
MYPETLAIILFWERREKKTQNQGFFDFHQKPETRGHNKIKELSDAHCNCLALRIFSSICKCN